VISRRRPASQLLLYFTKAFPHHKHGLNNVLMIFAIERHPERTPALKEIK
jgi:hypothetical protein